MTEAATTDTSASGARAPTPADRAAAAASVGGAPGDAWAEAFARAPKKGIQITEGAARFGRQKLEIRGTPEAAIRLGIKGGGCSGFSYVIQFEDGEPRTRDYAYEVDGVRFVVDKKSLVYLAGSVFDYEKTLMFQGFKFKNPNEAASCGCGHSFTVK
jgi:iron-sulfur cluster assembly protein